MKEKGEKKGESANNAWKYTQKVTKIKEKIGAARTFWEDRLLKNERSDLVISPKNNQA